MAAEVENVVGRPGDPQYKPLEAVKNANPSPAITLGLNFERDVSGLVLFLCSADS
jgi:hypothetical protein